MHLRLMCFTLLGLTLAGTAHAVPVPGLFNTGVDATGAVLSDGAIDPHYVLISTTDPGYPGPAAYASWPIATPYWVANDADSRWIGPAINESYPVGAPSHPSAVYIYRLTFDLTGIDPSTVAIQGFWGVDNNGGIHINDQIGPGTSSYNPLASFSFNYGFVPGINHLDFYVSNTGGGDANPTGLRVTGITGTGTSTVDVPLVGATGGLELASPMPNPASRETRIAYTLPRRGDAWIGVIDLAGRIVRVLAAGESPAGRSELTWDGVDANGAHVQPGIYFVRLDTGAEHLTRRIVWSR